MSNDALKVAASQRALEYVESGMRLGLGTGSTAAKFVDLLGRRLPAVSTSCACRPPRRRGTGGGAGHPHRYARRSPFLDLTVDGADELDGELR